jgi:hypothetical protein
LLQKRKTNERKYSQPCAYDNLWITTTWQQRLSWIPSSAILLQNLLNILIDLWATATFWTVTTFWGSLVWSLYSGLLYSQFLYIYFLVNSGPPWATTSTSHGSNHCDESCIIVLAVATPVTVLVIIILAIYSKRLK